MFVKILVLCFSAIAISCLGQSDKKPNGLFLISGDLTATALSNYENPVSDTPSISSSAERMMMFGEIIRSTPYPLCRKKGITIKV